MELERKCPRHSDGEIDNHQHRKLADAFNLLFLLSLEPVT